MSDIEPTETFAPPFPGWEQQPFDRDQVKSLLMEVDGNVTEAAKRLEADPARLRKYVEALPELRSAVQEAMEEGVDAAIAVLFEGLRDKMSFQNRYYAAKEFLRSEAGRRRGFGPREPTAAQLEVKTGPKGGGTITLKWLEPPKEER
jgi:hypothetical protein